MAGQHSSRGARRRWLVDVARWHPTPEQFQAAVSVLPPDHGPDIARFVKDDDRKRALISRLLQYTLVHQVLGIPFREISISRTAEGKPYLQNKSPSFRNFNFNTSHQGDYVGIASELLCLVGLDIVCIDKPPGETTMEFVRNLSSYLTVHEWNCIVCAGGSVEMLTEFYRYWCLKEAFVKAIGAGVGYGLHRLEFHHVYWSSISVYIDGVESKNWKFCLFKLGEEHLTLENGLVQSIVGLATTYLLQFYMKLQASIAKGDPEDAIDSYKKTLSSVVVEEEELHATVEIPEEPFTLLTVEQLIQFQE